MSIKEHYDTHLAHFYAWYAGDFEQQSLAFKTFCEEQNVRPTGSGVAIDLGCGHGIQSFALAQLGFHVKAIDFCDTLQNELTDRINQHPIEPIKDDIRNIYNYVHSKSELIVCCGDTISHLASIEEIETLLNNTYSTLQDSGHLILSFRDYSQELLGEQRFIPVKSDDTKIHTCFLEYHEKHVVVTDLLHEKTTDGWKQKVSSYPKVRITVKSIRSILESCAFTIQHESTVKGMMTLIAQKVD